MGNVTLSTSEVLTAIAGAAAIVTAIWHAAMYVGKLTVKVDRHEDRLNAHDEELHSFRSHIK
jgi:hypothetical protein